VVLNPDQSDRGLSTLTHPPTAAAAAAAAATDATDATDATASSASTLEEVD
jgi:hypothetical protein